LAFSRVAAEQRCFGIAFPASPQLNTKMPRVMVKLVTRHHTSSLVRMHGH